MTTKHTINLLQAELFPQKPFLTLTRVMLAWGLSIVVMALWALLTEISYSESAATYDALLKDKQQKTQRVKSLEAQVQKRQVSAALTNELNSLQLVMRHKDALLTKLTNTNDTFAGGFVMAMNDLSAMHHKDIRLQTISINSTDMSFTGLARTPQAVPAWLAGFQKSRLLSGKAFVQFKLDKNEQNITEFVVSSVAKKGES
ncbi:PilN domain-containing protein [Colwelliaceae bacterium MEBiC 14330]